MQVIDHVASAAALATLAGLKPRRWLAFVTASTLIDLDHYPGALRHYALRNPLDGARYALTGRVPGWRPNDPRYPPDVERPLHRPEAAAGLLALALWWPRARPVAVGMLWHLLLDLVHGLCDREPG